MAMSSELEGLLGQWLPRQSWFPALGRETGTVLSADAGLGEPDVIPMSDTQVFELDFPVSDSADPLMVQGWVAVVAVGTGENTRRLSVPLTLRTREEDSLRSHLVGRIDDFMLGECFVYDGVADPVFVLYAATAMARGDSGFAMGGDQAQLTSVKVGDGSTEFDDLTNVSVLWHRATTTRLKFDESRRGETAVIVDDHAFPSILTFFRVLDAVNTVELPESVRMPIMLTVAESSAVAPVLGWMAARWFDGTDLTTHAAPIAMLTRSEPSVTTAWNDAVDAAVASHDGVAASYAKRARDLGGRVAQLHVDLGRELGAVEGTGEPTAELVHKWSERVDWALARAPLALGPLERQLRAHKRFLSELSSVGQLQRVHGGLTLNQVAKAPVAGFTVANFPENTELRPPAFDLVALLRSVDYAAGYAFLARTGALSPGAAPSTLGTTGLVDEELIAEVNNAPETRWSHESQRSLLAGYSQVGGATFNLADPVLRAMLIDRLLVEVVSELRNRPTWLIVPLAELTRVLNSDIKVATEPARLNPRTTTPATRLGIEERLEAHRAAQQQKIAHARAAAAKAREEQLARDSHASAAVSAGQPPKPAKRVGGSTRIERYDSDTQGEVDEPPFQPKSARNLR